MAFDGQQHSFAVTPAIQAPRSVFDRRSTYKTTLDIGWIVPYFWDEIYPGDTFSLNSNVFLRLGTPKFPIMDRMTADIHWFFIPNRIIWSNWRKFCGEQEDPGDSIDFTVPKLNIANVVDSDINFTTNAEQWNALANYLGLPDGLDTTVTDVSALPFRAYVACYNHWYRDQNLISSLDLQTGDGPDIAGTSYVNGRLMRRGKRHDYFTSCLPWPQKPDATYATGVTLPLGTKARVATDATASTNVGVWNTNSPAQYETLSILEAGSVGERQVHAWTVTSNEANSLYADLTNATAATISDLREAFQIQKLLERDAMSGTRYPELILNHFGVTGFYDASYRPEYIGGSSFDINVSPVAQTAMTTSGGSTGVGDLAGIGTGFGQSNITKTFFEHGILMAMISVRADLHYQQGLRREFSRSTRYDYYWPSLSHLSMQPVYNKEIYCDGSANDDLVFGYQNRYDELRYRQSQITGLFQSAAGASLENWHLADNYSVLPTLGQTFIEVNTDLDRCIQVPSEPHFIMDSLTEARCARPMPVNATPGLIDHF